MARKIESVTIPGPVGDIEALLEEPDEVETATVAFSEVTLVCHPHPLFGGTMHNKVVYRMARGFRKSGSVVLRFNFRGVGRTQGAHDDGRGEMDDARACLEFLRARYPELPFSIAGFSFGSRVALQLGCSMQEDAVKPVRLVPVGFPTWKYNFDFLTTCVLPKYFVQSTNDEHGPRSALEAMFEKFPEPKLLQFIEARDHFFAGALEELEAVIASLPKQ